jgi:hypothetical protein
MDLRTSFLIGSLIVAVPLSARDQGALPASRGTTIEIETYWVPEGQNEFSFIVNGATVCQFSGRAPATENSTTGRCRFELPAGAKTLTVKGRYTRLYRNPRTDQSSPRTFSGDRTYVLRDGSVLTNSLRDKALSLAERWRRIVAAERTLVKSWDGIPIVDPGEPVAKARVDAAEAGLGFALPTGYRELVTQVGALEFGDNAVTAPGSLTNAHDTILKEWSYGDKGTPKWLSRDAADKLKRSVILFVEVGDGMGGDLYLAPPNTACGDRFATMFLHEESLGEDMKALADNHLSCTSFSDRLPELFTKYVVSEQASALADETGEILIDFGAAVQPLQLRYVANAEGRFEVDLGWD